MYWYQGKEIVFCFPQYIGIRQRGDLSRHKKLSAKAYCTCFCHHCDCQQKIDSEDYHNAYPRRTDDGTRACLPIWQLRPEGVLEWPRPCRFGKLAR